MVQLQILEGTGEELQKHLKQHPNERFRLILLAKGVPVQHQSQPMGLRRGMFPELRGLTEEDFKAAEWHDEASDL
jgi:hypothetical protein